MKNAVYTMVAIAFCLALGKLLQHFIGGLPASLYGMMIYCVLLQRGWITPDKVKNANFWFIKHMGVCFVPAGVGIINHYELIQQHGVSLVVIIFLSTFVLLTAIGVLAQWHFKEKLTFQTLLS